MIDDKDLRNFQRISWLEDEVERLSSLEFSSVKDPTQALMTTVDYLRFQTEMRAIWANYTSNLYPNNIFGLTPNSFPLGYRDSRGFPYWTGRQPSDYMSNNGNTKWAIEAAIHSRNPTVGLTCGAWVRHTDWAASSSQGLLSSWNIQAGSRIWILFNTRFPSVVSGTDRPSFIVSSTGAASAGVVELAVTPTVDEWVFYVARWTPSSETKIWLFDGNTETTNTNTTSIPATLYRPTAGNSYGYVGAYLDGSGVPQTLEGDMGLSFFCANAMTDAEVSVIHSLSRNIYGV